MFMKEAIDRENWVEDTQKLFSNFLRVLYKEVLKTNQTKQKDRSEVPGASVLPGLRFCQHRVYRVRTAARAAAAAGGGGGDRPGRSAAQPAAERAARGDRGTQEEHGIGKGDGPFQLPLQVAVAHLSSLRNGQADRPG